MPSHRRALLRRASVRHCLTTKRGGRTSCRGTIGHATTALWPMSCAMSEEQTTVVVQRYLDEMGGDSSAEPIVRALLDRAVRRLHLLCARLLYRSYPRLTQPPLNLQVEELLGAVAERLLKAIPEARPHTLPQFAALATQPTPSPLTA